MIVDFLNKLFCVLDSPTTCFLSILYWQTQLFPILVLDQSGHLLESRSYVYQIRQLWRFHVSTKVRQLLAWVQSLYTVVLYNKHIHNFFIHSCKTIVHNNEGELTYTHKVFQILSTWYQCINITPLNINFKRIPRILSPRWWSVWWKERWCQLTRTTHTWISYIHTTTCWTE